MNTLETALHWLSLGIAPIPVFYRDKRPCFPWADYQKKLPTEQELRQWFEHRFRNVALITGWQDLVVLDFDNTAAFLLWQSWAVEHAPLVAELTYKVRTARGVHVYLALDNPPAGTMKLGLIDVKAAGGYVLAPPSTHPSGKPYTAVNPDAPILRMGSLADVLPPETLELENVPVYVPSSGGMGELPHDPWKAALSATPLAAPGDVTTIKQQHSILELFPDARPEKGKWWVARCPLHDDRTPSLKIDIESQSAYCHAHCTRGKFWDVIDFYAALHHLDNRQAIQELSVL